MNAFYAGKGETEVEIKKEKNGNAMEITGFSEILTIE